MMNRNYQSRYSRFINNHELIKQTAFHEAGHAAAIYLGNKKKKLPPVFFQICINETTAGAIPDYAKVEGGFLIQNLPVAGLENSRQITCKNNYSCREAYEADVVNLLVGPLAEAKYVATRDGEIFNAYLVNIDALSYYGGKSDLDMACAYLKYFIADDQERDEKLRQLFNQAYCFIEDPVNWTCTVKLAHHIMGSRKSAVSCEEVITVFDSCMH